MTVAHYAAEQADLPGQAQLDAQKPIRDVNMERAEGFTELERIAIWVTDRVGTMQCFFLIAIWTAFWLAWNTIGPQQLRFDPAPAFVLWLFISNLIQLHLMPLIMVTQNLQDRYAELRAEADFEVNKKAEAEVGIILSHLSHQNDLMLEILRRVERMEQSRAR